MPGLEIPVCPRCATANVPACTFCVACGGPLSIIATAGPFESALMQARAIGEVVGARRPSFVVVLGAWLLALPFLGPVLFLLALGVIWPGGRGAGGVVVWTVGALLAGVVGFVLWRVTSRYVRSRREPATFDGADSSR
jgi:hypothetical protein